MVGNGFVPLFTYPKDWSSNFVDPDLSAQRRFCKVRGRRWWAGWGVGSVGPRLAAVVGGVGGRRCFLTVEAREHGLMRRRVAAVRRGSLPALIHCRGKKLLGIGIRSNETPTSRSLSEKQWCTSLPFLERQQRLAHNTQNLLSSTGTQTAKSNTYFKGTLKLL